MIAGKVKKIMTEAIGRFAKEEGVEAKSIALGVHPNSEELEPVYFYLKDMVPKRTENDEIMYLDFTKQILNKRFDLLQTEIIAAQFLISTFKALAEEAKVPPHELFVIIQHSESHTLIAGIYHGGEQVKVMPIEQVFGE